MNLLKQFKKTTQYNIPSIFPLLYEISPIEVVNIKSSLYKKQIKILDETTLFWDLSELNGVIGDVLQLYNIKTNKKCDVLRVEDNKIVFYDNTIDRIVNSDIKRGVNVDNLIVNDYVMVYTYIDNKFVFNQNNQLVDDTYIKTSFTSNDDEQFLFIDVDLNYNEVVTKDLFRQYIIKYSNGSLYVDYVDIDSSIKLNDLSKKIHSTNFPFSKTIENDLEFTFNVEDIKLYIKMQYNDEYTLKTLDKQLGFILLVYNNLFSLNKYPHV